MQKAVLLSSVITLVFHVFSATLSFLTMPVYAEDLIMYRPSIDGGKDVAMNISKLALFIGLFFSSPGKILF